MQKRESKSSILLRHWLKANPQYSCSIEVKTTPTDSILFSAVEEAQLDWALAIRSEKGVLIRVQGQSGEPDYIYLRNTPSWIVIHYQKYGFVFISPDRFILEKDTSKRKSLLWSRACEISSKMVKV